MNVLLLADMAASARNDDVVVSDGHASVTGAELLALAGGAPHVLANAGALAYVGTNSVTVPVALFGAAAAGVPYVPLNFRLADEQLDDLLVRLERPLVVADPDRAVSLGLLGHRVIDRDAFIASCRAHAQNPIVPDDADSEAVLLFTSGTTATPKAAVLRHRHLTSYIFGTVEFCGADPTDTVLVAAPPYHVAGLANLLSNLFAGRRVCYLERFDADEWLNTVATEAVTHAMVVPTMLARIVEALETGEHNISSLRAVSYGGARTPANVLERAMRVLGDVALTNAYGLTETSSTIAVLGPDDHRAARDGDPLAIERLASAGKVLPNVEISVRNEQGAPVAAGTAGDIFVRGDQVSGEYSGIGSGLDADGWFPTRDRGWIDADGYLFIEGRTDDTIIRGGENIAPAEIEEALVAHPAVHDAAVCGVPDDEWGQQVAAAVVLTEDASADEAELIGHVRDLLRSSKTPSLIVIVDTLPYTDTGKLLRRSVQADLVAENERRAAPATR